MGRRGASLGATVAGTLMFLTWMLSAVNVGLGASAVARNIHSTIGIAHLVVSTLSLVLASGTCCAICCIDGSDGGEARQAVTFAVLFLNLLMYIAIVIPLSVNPISRPDIRAGQGQFLNTSLSDTDANLALSGHPYYGMFFVDLIMICKTVLGFLVLCCAECS